MAKPIYFANRFLKTWRNLSPKQKDRVIEIILVLPDLQDHPHRHSGYGFRKLHGSSFCEVRMDLRWRLIIRMDENETILFDVMNHDQVKRL
jgi:mRNA-degrading endonuclease RelE of RelBE toxin-antitoxin system